MLPVQEVLEQKWSFYDKTVHLRKIPGQFWAENKKQTFAIDEAYELVKKEIIPLMPVFPKTTLKSFL